MDCPLPVGRLVKPAYRKMAALEHRLTFQLRDRTASSMLDHMNVLLSLSAAQLGRAANIKEQIEKLQSELDSLFSGDSTAIPHRGPGRPRKVLAAPLESFKVKRRKMSAAGRARIAAAAKARWAKARAAGKDLL
jgi:hypothetical protein